MGVVPFDQLGLPVTPEASFHPTGEATCAGRTQAARRSGGSRGASRSISSVGSLF